MTDQQSPWVGPTMERCEGWYSRTIPHPDPRAVTPSYPDLVIALDVSSMVYQGLVMALFEPDIVVDRYQRIRTVQQSDFQCLKSVLREMLALPYAPSWSVYTDITCQPGFQTFIPQERNGTIRPVYVGAPGRGQMLERVTVGYERLPDAIFDVIEMAEEAWPLWIDSDEEWWHLGNRTLSNAISKMLRPHCQWMENLDEESEILSPDWGSGSASTSGVRGVELIICLMIATFVVLMIRRGMRRGIKEGMVP